MTNEDALEARNTVTPAISGNSPQRPIGILATKALNFSGSSISGLFISVPNGPGQMALTVTPRSAHSSARTRVRLAMPALEAASGARPGSPIDAENQPEVDHPAPPARGHAGAEQPRAQERAFEVGVDGGVPVGFGELVAGPTDIDAGVVDQDVHRAQACPRPQRPCRVIDALACTSAAYPRTLRPVAAASAAAASVALSRDDW